MAKEFAGSFLQYVSYSKRVCGLICTIQKGFVESIAQYKKQVCGVIFEWSVESFLRYVSYSKRVCGGIFITIERVLWALFHSTHAAKGFEGSF